MRLLRTDTLTLKLFTDESKLPEYAILSHTWLEKQADEEEKEVLYTDMRDLEVASKKEGWNKIAFAKDQAIRDRLNYVWIDTCCIDKESSAELSEAINSMYRWYGRSKVCYVYLDDIDGEYLSSVAVDPVAFILKCRWFTRGWTLQEMIASPRLEFYNKRRTRIGTLSELANTIATATGVHLDILNGRRALRTFSIAQRMSWAAHRQTTRVEDRAYCLLGIFDVSLAVIYGEGERAFQRLQEELLRFNADHTIFAWGFGGQNTPSNLLAASPDDFGDDRSRRLIATPGSRSRKQYEVLGGSISFDVPVRKGSWKDTWLWTDDAAVLNCCFEGLPTRCIVIELQAQGKGDFIRTAIRDLDIFDASVAYTSQRITVLRYTGEVQGADHMNQVPAPEPHRLLLRCKETVSADRRVEIVKAQG